MAQYTVLDQENMVVYGPLATQTQAVEFACTMLEVLGEEGFDINEWSWQTPMEVQESIQALSDIFSLHIVELLAPNIDEFKPHSTLEGTLDDGADPVTNLLDTFHTGSASDITEGSMVDALDAIFGRENVFVIDENTVFPGQEPNND